MGKRNATIGLGLSLLASVGVASYLAGRRAVPSWSGRVKVDGVTDTVDVVRDRYGVPALRAAGEDDLFAAQGYLHAADRLFQMDLMRRLTYGRISEVVGEAGIASDRLVRVLGFNRQVDAELDVLSPQTRAVLDAYTRGVNSFLHSARRRLPVEFRVLGYRPDPWQPQHCLVASRLMALGLCGNWESELARAEIAGRLGSDVLQVLDADADARPFAAQVHADVLGELVAAAHDVTEVFGGIGGTGSNNWVIGPRRTRDNGALLANDPHLDLQLPSVWYEQLLRCPGFEVRGFTVPGIPGVVLGHNARIAWGFTNSCADVQDLYGEQLDDAAGTYRDTDGSDQPLELREERIGVKGRHDEVVTVRSTRRGPIITDVVRNLVDDPLSMRWDAMRPGHMSESAMLLNRATCWQDFRAALRLWSAPAQNVVYADAHGNIGFQHAGLVPIRAGGNGTTPQRGDDPAGDWTGEIPFDEHPSAFNPTAGRIVTANDRIVADDFPHFLSVEWMNGYRGQRIRELIDERDEHTVERQVGIQTDVRSLPAAGMLTAIEGVLPQPSTSEGRALLDALRAWDHELRADGDGAAAWRLLLPALREQVFGFLGELMPQFLGYSRTGVNGFWALIGRTTPRLIDNIARDDRTLLELGQRVAAREAANLREGWQPASSWGELVERALDAAGARYAGSADAPERSDSSTPPRLVGRTPLARVAPRRRRVHRLRLQHPLGVVPGLAAVANYGPFPMPGDADTVLATTAYNNPLNEWAMVGPSHRHVIDLHDLDASVAVLAGGQSGHPASPHYVDQVPLWRAGKVRPAPWSPEAIERAARYHQQLVPG